MERSDTMSERILRCKNANEEEQKYETCLYCEGEGFITNEDYETGDCPECDTLGEVTVKE